AHRHHRRGVPARLGRRPARTSLLSVAGRVCSEPGCPEFAEDRGRCRLHRRTTGQRGYGAEHQDARRSLEATLPRFCAYGCGTWLTAASSWVAAHVVDGDPSAGWAVACGPCNERAKRTGSQPVAAIRTGSSSQPVETGDRVQTEKRPPGS